VTGLDVVYIVGAFVLILVGAEWFTNGVEWLGRKLNRTEGATGSTRAAFGTATPETLIPVIAILFTNTTDSDEIGVGAILGAPFMLGTLVMLLIGVTALAFRRRRGRDTLHVDAAHASRDLSFFLVLYTIALALALLPAPLHFLKQYFGWIFLPAYGLYLYLVLRTPRGTVAGAMVFQSTIPVTLGVLLTPWQLGQFGTVAAVFAIISGGLIWIQLRMRARENSLPLSSLMLGGSLYVVFIAYIVWSVVVA